MADLPGWLRIPDGFASSGDPVDGNPFPSGDARHRVWQDATRQAEEEWARVNAHWTSALSPENAHDWFPSLYAARFSVWAKRGIHVVWSDGAVKHYDDWLVRYANATLEMLTDFLKQGLPPTARDAVLLATRNRICERIQYWKAEARRYRADQEAELRRKQASAATPEFWQSLEKEFRGLPGLSVDAHCGIVGPPSSPERFKALARRGGIALGFQLPEAFQAWLTKLARHLRTTRSPWLHPNRVPLQDLIALGNDDYAQRGADGALILEADVWLEHVSEASAAFCMTLETEALADQIQSTSFAETSDVPARDTAPVAPAATPNIQSTRRAKRAAVVEPKLKSLGLTRSGWATRAGVDPSVVYDFLEGKSNPRPESRNVLAEVLGIDELPE